MPTTDIIQGVMPLITPEQLNTITDTLIPDRCKVMAGLLNELCLKYGITDKGVFEMFLANVLQESSEFNKKKEDLYYTTPERIKAVWPTRFKTVTDAVPYLKNPQKLGNFVYGGRLGNTGPNDGYLFSGNGFIGITGRQTFTKYADYINQNIEEAATLVRTTDRYALGSACWFFAVLKDLVTLSKKGDFKAVCRAINGGLIGYDVRLKYYQRCKKVVG